MTEHWRISLFWLYLNSQGPKCLWGGGGREGIRQWSAFRARRTGPRPPSRMRMERWACRPLLPPSIWRLTEMCTCSCVSQSFGRCFCPPSCASPAGSETRSSPVSLTSSGTLRSRCAAVWRGTCSRWTLAPAPKVACWWKLCACVCCSEVCCCRFLRNKQKKSISSAKARQFGQQTKNSSNRYVDLRWKVEIVI